MPLGQDRGARAKLEGPKGQIKDLPTPDAQQAPMAKAHRFPTAKGCMRATWLASPPTPQVLLAPGLKRGQYWHKTPCRTLVRRKARGDGKERLGVLRVQSAVNWMLGMEKSRGHLLSAGLPTPGSHHPSLPSFITSAQTCLPYLFAKSKQGDKEKSVCSNARGLWCRSPFGARRTGTLGERGRHCSAAACRCMSPRTSCGW